MIDIAGTLGAVTRQVRRTDRDGREAKVVVAQRRYPFEVAQVWDTITSAERIPRWFMPVSGDLREGGRFQLEGNAGGEILECSAPTTLRITWEMGAEVSWVDVTLTSDGDATTLRLEHTAHVAPQFWDEYGPGAVGIGWELGLLGLGLHLESGNSVPPEFQGWEGTAEGREYIAASSEGWADASVAAGTDEAAARAAQERTTGFYTGVPEAGAG